MFKVFQEKKENLKFELFTDGKTARLVVSENCSVEVPTELVQGITYYVTQAQGSNMKCLVDGADPINPFERLQELEGIAQQQEEATESLRTQNEELTAALEATTTRVEELTAEKTRWTAERTSLLAKIPPEVPKEQSNGHGESVESLETA